MLLRTKLIATAVATVTTVAIGAADIQCLKFDPNSYVSKIEQSIGTVTQNCTDATNVIGKLDIQIGKLDTQIAELTKSLPDKPKDGGKSVIDNINNITEQTSNKSIENDVNNAVGKTTTNPYEKAWAYEYAQVEKANASVRSINEDFDTQTGKLGTASKKLNEAINTAEKDNPKLFPASSK